MTHAITYVETLLTRWQAGDPAIVEAVWLSSAVLVLFVISAAGNEWTRRRLARDTLAAEIKARKDAEDAARDRQAQANSEAEKKLRKTRPISAEELANIVAARDAGNLWLGHFRMTARHHSGDFKRTFDETVAGWGFENAVAITVAVVGEDDAACALEDMAASSHRQFMRAACAIKTRNTLLDAARVGYAALVEDAWTKYAIEERALLQIGRNRGVAAASELDRSR